MRPIYALILILAIAGACKGEEVEAHVNCKVNEELAIDCEVSQTKGKSEMDVCWDFKVECANGATLEAARTCAKVKDGSTQKATIAADQVKIEGSCEGERKAALTNMTFNGKKSDK